jgi:hypothetical protein
MSRSARVAAAALVVASTALLSAGMAEARPRPLVRGPYLQRPAPDGIVIVWEHPEPRAPTLRWGLTEELTERWTPGLAARRHDARLSGLEPGRTYFYALYGEDGSLLAEPATFPGPVASGAPFRFAVFGDTRSRMDVHRTVVSALGAEPGLAFYVNTGDLVSDGERADQWDTFFTIESSVMARLPLYPTIGNHDEHGGDAKHFVQSFVLPDAEYYYSFDAGNVHVVVLDGYVHSEIWLWCIAARNQWTDTCLNDAQLAWLQDDLPRAARDPAIDHIVVVNHIGPYSSKKGRVGSGQMRELLPWFRDMGVTFVVSGHDHYYERGFSGNGIPYVITGGGGAPLYDVGLPSPDPHEVVLNESVENYLLIEVDGPLMRVVTKTPDGRLLDEFTIDATPECVTADTCPAVEPTPACPAAVRACSPGGRCGLACTPEEPADGADAGAVPEADGGGSDDAGGGSDDAGGGSDDAGGGGSGEADAGDPAEDVPTAGADHAAPPKDDAAAPRPGVDTQAAADEGHGRAVAGGGGCAAGSGGSSAATLGLLALLAIALGTTQTRRRVKARARRDHGQRHRDDRP